MCEGLMQHIAAEDMLKIRMQPLSTCGIGQNLFVKPDGKAYPCYAWCEDHTFIGDAFFEGLDAVMGSDAYRKLMDCSVDTISKCRNCGYRYLCGGACRAWGNRKSLNLNAAPPQCDHLRERAQNLVAAAREYLR